MQTGRSLLTLTLASLTLLPATALAAGPYDRREAVREYRQDIRERNRDLREQERQREREWRAYLQQQRRSYRAWSRADERERRAYEQYRRNRGWAPLPQGYYGDRRY